MHTEAYTEAYSGKGQRGLCMSPQIFVGKGYKEGGGVDKKSGKMVKRGGKCHKSFRFI